MFCRPDLYENSKSKTVKKFLGKKCILIFKVLNNQKNFTDSNGVQQLGQIFMKMCKKMPFLAKMTYLPQKWHILSFLTHFLKHLTQLLYTVGISKIFLII